MIVKFFPKYSYEGASSRYRTYQYIPLFEKEGICCKVYPFFDKRHIKNINAGNKTKSLLFFIKYFLKRTFRVLFLKNKDIIFIEKELIPYFPPIFEWYLSVRNIKYILDYDDAIIHNYNLSSNKLIRKLLSEKIPYIQAKAENVINGSKYLLQLSEKNNINSIFIPTSLDIEKYIPVKTYEKTDFIIGWIGSHSTSKLILPILDLIENFCIRHNIKLHLIGFDEKLLNEKNRNIINVIEWSEETEIEEIRKFNIGISPTIDTHFARGKCAFKSIQYMACAKPVVTNPVGANADVVEHGVTGFHINSSEEWSEYLEYLYLNQNIAEKMGKAGRKKVENEFTIQKNYKK
ncbi:MAG: glycosyltransferase family 4 protein [Bacteroidales bacterium]|nr:glycosyltransferase family 4 protein [Bacteroidales bacterium]